MVGRARRVAFRNPDATSALAGMSHSEVASLPQIDVRKGMPPVKLSRGEFEKRYRNRFIDPVFRSLDRELSAIVDAAWDAYSNSRKSPVTRKAGPGFADPEYEISVDWLAAREAILAAQRRHDDASETPRILLINGSSRSEHTCPGEMSKTWRLIKSAEPVFQEMGFAVDILDLSRLASEFGKQIHPCKSCVSTSMALCHWPCSCYPNYSLGQTDDWMNEIYPLWVAAHGIMIVTPVNWYHAPTAHGDSIGAETMRRSLVDWLTDMSLMSAGGMAETDGYIGYMKPYATAHEALDEDKAFQEEVLNVARALGKAVNLHRAGKYEEPGKGLVDPHPK
jgi:NADPH-dependent FMN reductase